MTRDPVPAPASRRLASPLTEPSPFADDGGRAIGRHPDRIGAAEWDTTAVPRRTGIQAIRAKCLNCCAGQPGDVRKCVATTCPLWPFRLGTDLFRGQRGSGRKPEPAGDISASAPADAAPPTPPAAG